MRRVQPERIVIIGAGLAGLRTAEELRSGGYRGDLTLVGAENRPPYDRPPLSKQVLAGAVDDTTLRTDQKLLGAAIRLGETAVSLGDRVVRTDHAEHLFDALVVATGARPIALPGSGSQRFLRTLDDALSLRRLLVPGARLAVVGAGWIGAELATAAVGRGCQVTVVEAGPAPLAGAVGAEVGAITAGWYAQAGVELRLGQPVRSVEDGGLDLADGGWLPADLVVAAVGVRPEVGWLDGSGIMLTDGIEVDEHLRTALPGVYAVGDCAAFWSERFGRRMRPEHWDVALRAPAVLAANLLGGQERYDPVPYFWSEQFGRMIQYVGDHRGADRLIWRGSPRPGGRDRERWAACWLAGDRLVALLAVGLPRDVRQARQVIESGAAVDQALLADPDRQVREAARG
jgi:3-phenylpropionate/trans-cinnamate dioxygenase ferredoxin reductase subunit